MAIEDTGLQGYNMLLTFNAQDVSGQSNKVTLNPSKQVDEVLAFGVSWKAKASGIKDWKADVDIFYNEEANEATEEFWTALIGTAAVAFVATPAGGTAGDWTFTGNVHVADFSLEASPDGGFMMVSVSMEGTGALAKGVVT